MLTIAPPDSKPDTAALEAPGGFAWWYADLLDDHGNGLVVIWSWGLPFLPGRASAARRGAAQPALARPSLAVSLYENGKPSFYLLQEYSPSQVTWDGERRWSWGDSTFELSPLDGDGPASLVAHLDCALPGTSERLRGVVRVRGPSRRPEGHPTPSDISHHWAPILGPSMATADLTIGARRVRLGGTAYHDRNSAPSPLHDLGFHRWTWGRALVGGDLVAWYLLWPTGGGAPQAHVLRIDPDGHTHVEADATIRLGRPARALWGMRSWRTLTIDNRGEPWLTIERASAVDNGPFYIRDQVRVTDAEGRCFLGYSEVCEPGRIDRPWHRWLVRMCVHRTRGANSMWLPLFAGDRVGRFQRLATSLVGAPAQIPEVAR